MAEKEHEIVLKIRVDPISDEMSEELREGVLKIVQIYLDTRTEQTVVTSDLITDGE